MTFSPVVPGVLLLAAAAVVILLRLLTMWRLAGRPGQGWSTVGRWSGLTLAVALLLIAAARPALGSGAAPTTADEDAAVPNVFLVVDRSSDVAAIRDDATALLDRYPQSRFALITFAARPSLDWPLSPDNWSLRPVIAGLTPLPPDPAVNAAAAANVLRYQLIAAGQRNPRAQNLVFYFGSGAPGSPAPQGRFDPVAGSVDAGAVFGYGTDRDDDRLRGVAEQLGLPYQIRDPAQPLQTPEAAAALPDQPAPVKPDRTDLYWVFTLVAAVLLLFEIYLTVREYRRAARREVVAR
ncbi:Uncharacterised protein [Mycolicibacterium phlei]|jgi:Ca-activated chloride channel family protein|uniref:VWFA domain-containing protein n=1 Tax=Mycolicibacterium phlei DSM 43239 = CCUG 21000 TaxID=1226750 RepID=A0A5N5VDB1_MYCPH|nr:hypothetical protein [Mycolicibacterium phlei]VEG11346.1 Uncharacterised protein [Mycobacteroides chelonae]AMO63249.1 hypothetical protein MPHLCCUG_04463 [Mycolicibacterium phlei]KAB7759885.1 hypothetical protein MPHL21000_02340 [Mycolicibacterium phlei DSM 43239 = CCUG 21000]KXW68932.1 hypothetical protein MPHL43239_02395 [Mycolicibacterium phlei DSM 43239 = CCUG 21000]KXW79305.1 hypothetical protein JL15_02210 [Mycolicibacterium phlei DSM 43071]